MRYIEYLSQSKYGRLGIKHSVVTDGKHVLSYEMKTPLGKGKFYLYDYQEWKKFKKIILFEKNINYFNIEKYKGIEREGITCFEALNEIQPMPTVKERISRILYVSVCLVCYTFVTIGIGFLIGYYGFTVSEDEFLQTNLDICQHMNQ